MKSNWHYKRLDDVCEFRNGLWVGKKAPFIKVGVIRNTNFTKEGNLNDSDIANIDVERSQFEKRKLIPGDIILEKSGGGPKQPVGRVVLFEKTEGDYSFSNFTSLIRVKNRHELLPLFLHKYLHYLYISGVTESMQRHTTGIRNLEFNEYKSIEIPLPPLEAQEKIVKTIDKLFLKIEQAKTNTAINLSNAQSLFESYLRELTDPKRDWEEVSIKDIGVTQTGSTPKTSVKDYYGNFIPFIKPADVNIKGDGGIRYDNEGLSEDGLKVGRKINKDSILMVCIGASIGKVGFVTQSVSCNQQINTLTPKEKYVPKFFYYFLRTKPFFDKVIAASSQATLPIINKGKWEKLAVSYPRSIDEQKTIVNKLDRFSEKNIKLCGILSHKLSLLEELKKSVLQEAFEDGLE